MISLLSLFSNEREISVQYHLCEAPEGPVPGKWYRTLISRSILSGSYDDRRRNNALAGGGRIVGFVMDQVHCC